MKSFHQTTNAGDETMETIRTLMATDGKETPHEMAIIRKDDGTHWLHDMTADPGADSLEQIQDDSNTAVIVVIGNNGFAIIDAEQYTSDDGEDVVEVRGDEYTTYTSGTRDPLYRGIDETAARASLEMSEEAWHGLMMSDPIELDESGSAI